MPTTIALDLGSTRIKGARLTATGELASIRAVPAPPLTGDGEIREGDAAAYRDAAEGLLAQFTDGVAEVSLAVATQRSSLVIWEAATGHPVTPLVSWQDRRASAWCAAHRHLESVVTARTGLPLSPHFMGPKLALLMASDGALKGGMERGALRCGTLETYLLAHLSHGRVYRTDATVAARTLLMERRTGDWGGGLLEWFGVPRRALPEIAPNAGISVPLDGQIRVVASLSDQAAGAAAVLGPDPGHFLVNLGTGGFVLRAALPGETAPPGYLESPLPGAGRALEGTLNGIGPALLALAPGPTPVPDTDPAPAAFWVPDSAGIGTPHWRADRGPIGSREAFLLAPEDRRRVFLEGIVFRLREILEDLAVPAVAPRVTLAGGMAREPFLGAALGACTGIPVRHLDEPEATLLGAARLGAGMPPHGGIAPPPCAAPGGDYLAAKYAAWRAWMGVELGS